MKEEWKLVKSYDDITVNKNSLHLPGDKIYLSNKGRIKYNEIILNEDFGLFNKKGEISIVGSVLEDRIHRLVYTLFNKSIEENMIIHHIDGNHFNNCIDNLQELTVKEHSIIHAKMDNKYNNKEYVYYLESKRENSVKQFKDYLRKRVEEYLENKRQEHKNKTIQQKEENKLKKQQEIEEKLKSGLYQLNKNGKLCRTTTAKKGYVTPIEVRKKQSESITKKYKEDEEYHQRIVDANNRNKEKMRKSLSESRKGSKMITNSDGTKTWIYQK